MSFNTRAIFLNFDAVKIRAVMQGMTQAQRDEFLKNLGHAMLYNMIDAEDDSITLAHICINREVYQRVGENQQALPEISAAYVSTLEARPVEGKRVVEQESYRFNDAEQTLRNLWKDKGRPFVMGTSYHNGKMGWHS